MKYNTPSDEMLSKRLHQLSSVPARLSELLAGLSNEQVTNKPTPEEFSLTEHVCHLRDIEREGYLVRIHKILREENPGLPDVDGARLAMERDYNRESITVALQEFSEARVSSVSLLTGRDDAQLNRKGSMEGIGEITLKQLVEMMTEHDESHMEEIASLSARASLD